MDVVLPNLYVKKSHTSISVVNIPFLSTSVPLAGWTERYYYISIEDRAKVYKDRCPLPPLREIATAVLKECGRGHDPTTRGPQKKRKMACRNINGPLCSSCSADRIHTPCKHASLPPPLPFVPFLIFLSFPSLLDIQTDRTVISKTRTFPCVCVSGKETGRGNRRKEASIAADKKTYVEQYEGKKKL